MPKYSIVITTFQRPELLGLCLRSLPLEDPEFEVWVVDDGSWPPVELPVSTTRLHLLRQSNAGAAAGRNLAAAHASGEWLIFLDDDCRLTPRWSERLKQSCSRHPDSLLGGHTRNALTDNRWSCWSQQLIDCLYEAYNQAPFTEALFTGNNLACPRRAFLDMGGFDASFSMSAGEDQDFCHRWQGPRHYAPELVIEHYHRLSAGGFARQHFRYGRASGLLMQRRNRYIPKRAGFFGALWRRSLASGSLGCLLFAQLASLAGLFYQYAQSLQFAVQRGRHKTPPEQLRQHP